MITTGENHGEMELGDVLLTLSLRWCWVMQHATFMRGYVAEKVEWDESTGSNPKLDGKNPGHKPLLLMWRMASYKVMVGALRKSTLRRLVADRR